MDILIIHGYTYNATSFINELKNNIKKNFRSYKNYNNEYKEHNEHNENNKLNIYTLPYYKLLDDILVKDYNINRYSNIDKHLISYLYFNKTKLTQIKSYYKKYFINNFKNNFMLNNNLTIYTYSFGFCILNDIIDDLPKNYTIINLSDPSYFLNKFSIIKYNSLIKYDKNKIYTYYSFYDIVGNNPYINHSNYIICIEDIIPILNYINYYISSFVSFISVHLYTYKIAMYILHYNNLYSKFINLLNKLIYCILYIFKIFYKFIQNNIILDDIIINKHNSLENVVIIDNIFDYMCEYNNTKFYIIDNKLCNLFNKDINKNTNKNNNIIFYNHYKYVYYKYSKYKIIDYIYNIYKFIIITYYNFINNIYICVYYKLYKYNIINLSSNFLFNLIKLNKYLVIKQIYKNLNIYDIHLNFSYYILLLIYNIQNDFAYINYLDTDTYKNITDKINNNIFFNCDDYKLNTINNSNTIKVLCILTIYDLEYLINKILYYNNNISNISFDIYLIKDNNCNRIQHNTYKNYKYIKFIKYIDNIDKVNNIYTNLDKYKFHIYSCEYINNNIFNNDKNTILCIINNSLNIYKTALYYNYINKHNVISLYKLLLIFNNLYNDKS